MSKYIDVLRDKYDAVSSESPLEALRNKAEIVKESIDNFFSLTGEQEEVINIYESDDSGKTVMLENFSNMADVYQEYLDGMVTFVNEVCKQDVLTESVHEAYKERVETATKQDHGFIDIIGSNPKINPKQEIEMNEAVSLFDDMIGLNTIIDDQLDYVTQLYDESYMEDPVKASSIKLLCESVGYYWQKTLETMFESYENVFKSVENSDETPAFVLV